MNFWDEVDAREQARKRAAVQYRESLKLQQDSNVNIKKKDQGIELRGMKQVAEELAPSQPWMNSNTSYQNAGFRQPSPLPPIIPQSTDLSLQSLDSLQQQFARPETENNINASLLKDQLMSEKGRTSRLESELRQQNSVVASMQSQLDQQKFALNEIANNRFLGPKYEKQLSLLFEQQSKSNLRADALEGSLKQLLHEVKTRQSFVEQDQKEFETKSKIILDEIQNLKFKYEQFSLESVQADKELFLRTRELESNAVQDASAKQVVRNHDVKLVAVDRELQSLKEGVDMRVGKVVQEVRQQAESAEKRLVYFEANVAKQYSDLKNVVEMFTRDASNKFLSVREKVMSSVESDLSSMNGQIREIMSQVKKLELDSHSRISAVEHGLEEKLSLIHSALREEISTRKHSEKALRGDTETLVKSMHLDVQNMREHYEGSLAKARSEFALMMSKTLDERDKLNHDVDERLRSVEDRLLNDVKKQYESSQGLKTWTEAAILRVTQELQTSLDSRLSIADQTLHAAIKRLEVSYRSEIDKSLLDLRENDLKLFSRDLELFKGRITSMERSVLSRLEELASQHSDLRSKVDNAEIGVIHDSQLQKVKENLQLIKNDVEKHGLKLSENDAASKDVALRLETALKELEKCRADLETKASSSQLKEELSHFDNSLKTLESSLKKTWKAIDGNGSADNGKTSLVTEVLSDIQSQNEKISAIQKSNVLQEKNLRELSDHVANHLVPKLNDIDIKVVTLKHQVDDDVTPKLNDTTKDFGIFRNSTAKSIMQQREQIETDYERLNKALAKTHQELDDRLRQLQKQSSAIETQIRKNQERSNQSHVQAMDEQLQKFSRWREDIHLQLNTIQEALDNLPMQNVKHEQYRDMYSSDLDDDLDLSDPDDELTTLSQVAPSDIRSEMGYKSALEEEDDSEYVENITKVLQDADRLLAEHDMSFLTDDEDSHLDRAASPKYKDSKNSLKSKEKLEDTRKSILKSLNNNLSTGKLPSDETTDDHEHHEEPHEEPLVGYAAINQVKKEHKLANSSRDLSATPSIPPSKRVVSVNNLDSTVTPKFERPQRVQYQAPQQPAVPVSSSATRSSRNISQIVVQSQRNLPSSPLQNRVPTAEERNSQKDVSSGNVRDGMNAYLEQASRSRQNLDQAQAISSNRQLQDDAQPDIRSSNRNMGSSSKISPDTQSSSSSKKSAQKLDETETRTSNTNVSKAEFAKSTGSLLPSKDNADQPPGEESKITRSASFDLKQVSQQNVSQVSSGQSRSRENVQSKPLFAGNISQSPTPKRSLENITQESAPQPSQGSQGSKVDLVKSQEFKAELQSQRLAASSNNVASKRSLENVTQEPRQSQSSKVDLVKSQEFKPISQSQKIAGSSNNIPKTSAENDSRANVAKSQELKQSQSQKLSGSSSNIPKRSTESNSQLSRADLVKSQNLKQSQKLAGSSNGLSGTKSRLDNN